MALLYPLRFRPIFRRYLWGGRRLESSLGKPIPPGNDWGESWEISDHGADQGVVEFGPMAGITLAELTRRHGEDLLGRDAPQPRFPLLLKYLDAVQTLSVQVHPDDARAARLAPPDLGKTEAWFVLDAGPESVIYAGLKHGVDRRSFAAAISEGRCQECLHTFRPAPGDCLLLPAGTVHSLGAGILVAEIQQSSDVTYRLFDWNRLTPEGRLRPLHVEAGLDAVDFDRGPVEPVRPRPTDRPHVERLIDCEKFMWDRWELRAPASIGGDDRCHILAVLDGELRVEGDPGENALRRGATALVPAGLGAVELRPVDHAVFLDAYLP